MLVNILVALIKFYQGSARGFLPAACRFYPSCSEYAKQALIKYGFLKGSYLAAKRLLRCHPLSGKAGYDPIL
ncbi:MAG: membrane protein insertion efficiency factor YidD [Candidatus Omnitrophica bacterium]|nr:membrane protein insertion efficiency factor YidD [Candidatus Omnitrophota bacterium]